MKLTCLFWLELIFLHLKPPTSICVHRILYVHVKCKYVVIEITSRTYILCLTHVRWTRGLYHEYINLGFTSYSFQRVISSALFVSIRITN